MVFIEDLIFFEKRLENPNYSPQDISDWPAFTPHIFLVKRKKIKNLVMRIKENFGNESQLIKMKLG